MPKQYNFQEVKAGIENRSLVVVDVRNKDEIKGSGEIPGAINITLPEVVDAFKLPPAEFLKKYGVEKDATTFCFSCQAGKRAAIAAEKVKTILPEDKISVYPGSFSDWSANGGQIKK